MARRPDGTRTIAVKQKPQKALEGPVRRRGRPPQRHDDPKKGKKGTKERRKGSPSASASPSESASDSESQGKMDQGSEEGSDEDNKKGKGKAKDAATRRGQERAIVARDEDGSRSASSGDGCDSEDAKDTGAESSVIIKICCICKDTSEDPRGVDFIGPSI